jgi:hypothetical protein
MRYSLRTLRLGALRVVQSYIFRCSHVKTPDNTSSMRCRSCRLLHALLQDPLSIGSFHTFLRRLYRRYHVPDCGVHE